MGWRLIQNTCSLAPMGWRLISNTCSLASMGWRLIQNTCSMAPVLETDCRPKAFSNLLDLVIACPAYVLSGAWKLQLPRNHTREAFYSPQRASSVGLKLRLLLRPSRTLDSCRLGAASLACGSMFACLALRLQRCPLSQSFDTNVTKCVAYYG